MPDPSDDATGDGPDYRQLSIVALAAAAIVLAAFLAPAGNGIISADIGSDPNANVDPERDPNVDPSEVPERGTDGEPPFGGPSVPEIDIRWDELPRWFEFGWFEADPPEDVEPPEDPEFVSGDGRLSNSPCQVTLAGDPPKGGPTPGHDLTVAVRFTEDTRDHRAGDPVVDIPVYYNDEYVGETDEEGRVTGEVPYEEELVVRLDTSDHPECVPSASAGVGASAGPAVGVGTTANADSTVHALASRQEGDDGDNATVEYPVNGEVEIEVTPSEPTPGEPVTLEATIGGAPMPDATVTVDGESVTETDADGAATVEAPTDTDAFELGVSRGDFSGTTTVDVRLLEVSLDPHGLAPIPGSPGVVEATIDDSPVDDAEVRIDGEAVGRTDSEGRLDIALPLDPTAEIAVSTGEQTRSVTLVGLYGDIAAVVGLAVVGLAAVAYRTHGPRAAAAVLGATGAALIVLIVEAFFGRVTGGATLLAFVLLAAGTVYVRSDGPLVEDAPNPGDAADGTFEWLVDRVLALVALLERGVDCLRARLADARARFVSLPRSGRALVAAFGAWLAALPARALAAGRDGLAVLERVPLRTVAAGLAAVATVAAGYALDGSRGAAIVAVALGIAALLLRRSDDRSDTDERETTDESDEDDGSDEDTATSEHLEEDDPGTDDRLTFRELWRAFARRVAPRRWPTHTPGEIRRSAREQGYPDRPVDELTTLFREVEYGGRPLSSGLRDRADAAYTELLEAQSAADGETESEADGATDTDGHGERDRADADGDGNATADTDTDIDDPATRHRRGGDRE